MLEFYNHLQARTPVELLESMRAAVAASVPPGGVGVAFSGGVDSALLALLCAERGGVTALTVGMPGSADLEAASEAAKECGLDLRTAHVGDLDSRLGGAMRAMGGRLSWAENAVAFERVCELASDLGLGTVAAANGIDELFCGYDAYRREYGSGPARLESMIDEKLESELEMFGAMGPMIGRTGVRLAQPFLSPGFAERARAVPLELKVRGAGDTLRKHAVREAAARRGVPARICSRPKKALQYGSGIHRAALRSLRRASRTAPPRI